MSDMEPCPQCGGKVEATGAPLFGWTCPRCRALWLPEPLRDMSKEELEVLLLMMQKFWHEAEEKLKELETYIKKTQPMIDAFVAAGVTQHQGKWVNHRAEKAEAALVKIKESYEARSELFTSDADCAANLAAWAETALRKEKP